MKRIVLLALLALALPVAAFGDQVSFLPQVFPQGGTLAGSASGLTLIGSMEISEIYGLGGNNYFGGQLGTIALTTGPLTSGSLTTSATFGPGGSLVITGSGNNGGPTGVLFSGTFSSYSAWNKVGAYYSLIGFITGTLYSGGSRFAASGSVDLFGWVNTGGNEFTMVPGQNGGVYISPDSTPLPEPSTLGLLGTGLAGLAGVIRRKLRV